MLEPFPPGSRAFGFAVILISLAAMACSPSAEPVSPPLPSGRGKNVLPIVLDTVRADRIGPRLTPALEKIAEDAIRFRRAVSTAPWTLPAHASLFTGTHPITHRATQKTLRLDTGLPTLAELYSGAGFSTFGVSANPLVSRENGLARGFGRFVETFRPSVASGLARGGMHPNSNAFMEFLRAQTRERPFFAFINHIEARSPYRPPVEFRKSLLAEGVSEAALNLAMGTRMPEHYLTPGGLDADRLELMRRLYDGEIRYLDAVVAQLLELLAADGRLEETLLVLTSDHGENFGEKGHVGHVFDVQNTLLHVPLMLRLPNGSGGGTYRDDLAQLTDLFPTLLSWSGLEVPEPRPAGRGGRNLVGETPAGALLAVSEYYYPRQVFSVPGEEAVSRNLDRLAPCMRRMRAIQDRSFKLIWTSDGPAELYDLSQDPGEARNLAGERAASRSAEGLEEALDAWVEARTLGRPLPLPPSLGWRVPGLESEVTDPEVLERLRSLGYVQ